MALVAVLGLLAAACGSNDGTSDGDGGDGAAEAPGDTGGTDTDDGDDAGDDGDGDGDDGADADGEPFYAGKSIEIIVPTAPGGGSDATARYIAPYLAEHIPGNPSVQVVNIEGGGLMQGTNEFVLNRDPDGETLLLASATVMLADVLGNPAAQFTLADFQAVLATELGNATIVRTDTGITNYEELVGSDEELIFGAISGVGSDLPVLVGFEVLGIPHRAIIGYEGTGAIRIAFEQGETNLHFENAAAYGSGGGREVVDEVGELIYGSGLVSGGTIVPDPGFEGLPTILEVYQDVHGEEPSGVEWDAYIALMSMTHGLSKALVMHADAPQEAVDAVVEGLNNAQADPAFYEEGAAALGPYPVVVGSDAQGILDSALQLDDTTRDWILDFVRGYGIELE